MPYLFRASFKEMIEEIISKLLKSDSKNASLCIGGKWIKNINSSKREFIQNMLKAGKDSFKIGEYKHDIFDHIEVRE